MLKTFVQHLSSYLLHCWLLLAEAFSISAVVFNSADDNDECWSTELLSTLGVSLKNWSVTLWDFLQWTWTWTLGPDSTWSLSTWSLLLCCSDTFVKYSTTKLFLIDGAIDWSIDDAISFICRRLIIVMLVLDNIWNCTVYLQLLARHRPNQYSRFTGVLTDLSQSIRLVFFVYSICV